MAIWPIVLNGKHDGSEVSYSKARLKQALKGARPGPVVVTVERLHATRSLAANSYYWVAVVQSISEHTGYEPLEVHELLKARFLPRKIVFADKHGEIVEEVTIGKTTTRLTKLEFGDYIRAIKAWALEKLDVVIPEPKDSLYG